MLAVYEAHESTPDQRARALFLLAQASWEVPEQRARARELAERALEAHADPSAPRAVELADWLAKHPVPDPSPQ